MQGAYFLGMNVAAGPSPTRVRGERPTVRLSRPLVIAAASMGILLAATMALWARYGAEVFYEMIAAGLAFCL
jgi:hypothetical protein